MLADVGYFNSRISKLEGTGDLGERVINVVRAKAISSEAGAVKRSPTETSPEEKPQAAPAAGNTETT